MSNDGKIFVRACPMCGKSHQTADQLGKTRCDKCIARKGAPPEPEPPPVIEETDADDDSEGIGSDDDSGSPG